MRAWLQPPFDYTAATLIVAALSCGDTDATPQSNAEATATIETARLLHRRRDV
jgi:hypothetical protein